MTTKKAIFGLGLSGLVALVVGWELWRKPADNALSPPDAADHAKVDKKPTRPKIDFGQHVAPLLTRYCVTCHRQAKARGGVVLDGIEDPSLAAQLWDKVATVLASGTMPPEGRAQPTAAELDTLFAWLDDVLSPPERRLALRRLNRAEYDNTIRDLVGLDFHLADDFPADDVGYGFDNIGELLSVSPLLLEKYLAAAEKIVEVAFKDAGLRQRLLRPPGEDFIPAAFRAFTPAVRAEAKKRLIRSKADLEAPIDPMAVELDRAYRILRAFADRAFRRPATHEEVLRLLAFVEAALRDGEEADAGIRVALQAILVSPHFLFRVEMGPEWDDGSAPGLVSDFELASRLSYFLWSSMPDEALFRDAALGKLRQPEQLAGHLRRMLADPKAGAFCDRFAGQWLQTRSLKDCTPDPTLFPTFDPPLRSAMLQETRLFFEAVVKEDRSILDLLDGDFTFVNERLAGHYGLKGVTGGAFRKVSLHGTPRGGILTHASILTVTSHPTRASLVKRGKWILDNVLGMPPPPPPPGADSFNLGHDAVLSDSFRSRLDKHRASADCASCHQRIDPLGAALENFDGIGAWRTHDGQHAIDASGQLPSGQRFEGPSELRKLLRSKHAEAFTRCLVEKLMTYALGRGIEPRDQRTVKEIVATLTERDYRFSALAAAIVTCAPFQQGVKGRRKGL
jgi:hypothetical protein